MKIGITGHCNGLGNALYNKFTIYNRYEGHSVFGFDVKNGYDISKVNNISKMLWQIKDFDIFVNNAYHNIGQTEILKYLLKLWKNQNKIIIHIGTYLIHEEVTTSLIPLHEEYIRIKKDQKKLIDDHRIYDNSLKIILVNPGLMQTEFLKTMQVPESKNLLNVLDCADAIIYTLNMLDKGVYIKELTLNNL